MPEMTKPRPKFLTLYQIRLPLAGFVSILHRISGAGLFLLLPLLIYTLQSSLDPQLFRRSKTISSFRSSCLVFAGPTSTIFALAYGICCLTCMSVLKRPDHTNRQLS